MDDRLFPPAEHCLDVHTLKRQYDEKLRSAEQCEEKAARCEEEVAQRFYELGQICHALKQAVGHGNWGPYVRDVLRKSPRTVEKWMQLANAPPGAHLVTEWKRLCGHPDNEEEATECESDQPSAGDWTPCRDHRYSHMRYPSCPRCRALNAPDTSPDTAKPNNRRSSRRKDRSMEPKPPPWAIAASRGQKAAAIVAEQAEEIGRMVHLPAARKSALRQCAAVAAEIFAEAAQCTPIPLKPSFNKPCDKCQRPIVVAMKEDRGWIVLEESTKGNWDVIGDMACYVKSGGQYRFHGLSCKQSQLVSNEPLPE